MKILEKMQIGTSNADNSLSISEIEKLWSELRRNNSELYSDLLDKLLSNADESDLIRKIKQNISKKVLHCEPINDIPDPS